MDAVKDVCCSSCGIHCFISILLLLVLVYFLLSINWELALPVIAILPIIGITFFLVLKKVKVLFTRTREVIDWLNKVINESVLGSAIIRVLNSQQLEYLKFMDANKEAKNLGISILTLFAMLIPAVTFVANLATLAILALGWSFGD